MRSAIVRIDESRVEVELIDLVKSGMKLTDVIFGTHSIQSELKRLYEL